ncbi:MAG: hypothetical protein ABIR36_11025 [Nitrospiraceae bacterium]
MATGLEAWLFGYAGKKLADKIFEMFRNDKFSSELQATVDKWSTQLPPGACIASSAALFPSHVLDSELGDRHNLAHLRSEMRKSVAPTSADWESALIEQWKYVQETIEDPQEFFTIPESEAVGHLGNLAKQLAEVCVQHEPLFRSTAMRLLREILNEVKDKELKTDFIKLANRALTEDHKKLLQRLYKFDGRCGVWAAKGECESLWVPGAVMNMQWGWERTAVEARLSGKDIGDRKNRHHWIYIVESLVDGGLLQEVENAKGLFELTKQGWRVAHELPAE